MCAPSEVNMYSSSNRHAHEVIAPRCAACSQDASHHITSHRNREQSGDILACKRPLCLQTSAAALSRWPTGLVSTTRLAQVAAEAYRSSALLLKT